ncbi:Fanconi anemia core complex-associated protein 20 [Tamandua tetradactyla]|uniref:Fanconi anemia core complex-associated protein 20 n=1 Tax=Tamandua tetradactyla TaxID=48850 RepID=UPI0040546A8A
MAPTPSLKLGLPLFLRDSARAGRRGAESLGQGSGGGKGPLGVGDPDALLGGQPPQPRWKMASAAATEAAQPQFPQRVGSGGLPLRRSRAPGAQGGEGPGWGRPRATGETGRGRGLGARPTPPTPVPPRPALVRAPAEPPPDPPRRPRDPSWFLGDAASERDPLWTALLRAVGADPSPAGDPLPPLPAAPGQDPRPGPEREAPPEVFTVGPRAFLWTPLSPAPGASGGLARSSSLPCAAGRHPGALSVSSASSPRLHPTPEPPRSCRRGRSRRPWRAVPCARPPSGPQCPSWTLMATSLSAWLKAPRTWHAEVEPVDTACLAPSLPSSVPVPTWPGSLCTMAVAWRRVH